MTLLFFGFFCAKLEFIFFCFAKTLIKMARFTQYLNQFLIPFIQYRNVLLYISSYFRLFWIFFIEKLMLSCKMFYAWYPKHWIQYNISCYYILDIHRICIGYYISNIPSSFIFLIEHILWNTSNVFIDIETVTEDLIKSK